MYKGEKRLFKGSSACAHRSSNPEGGWALEQLPREVVMAPSLPEVRRVRTTLEAHVGLSWMLCVVPGHCTAPAGAQTLPGTAAGPGGWQSRALPGCRGRQGGCATPGSPGEGTHQWSACPVLGERPEEPHSQAVLSSAAAPGAAFTPRDEEEEEGSQGETLARCKEKAK